LLLALAGLYTAVSSTVERRRREISIRMALGATRKAIFAMIFRQAMAIAILATAAGLIAGQLGSQFLPVSGTASWLATAGAAGLMIATSLIACAIPALLALTVDPATVFREQTP
jgi:ABC-type antimicrobial peptide transport system permease subunit